MDTDDYEVMDYLFKDNKKDEPSIDDIFDIVRKNNKRIDDLKEQDELNSQSILDAIQEGKRQKQEAAEVVLNSLEDVDYLKENYQWAVTPNEGNLVDNCWVTNGNECSIQSTFDVNMEAPLQIFNHNSDSNITFIDDSEEMLKITSDGFYVRGVKVEQNEKEAELVFQAFSNWMKQTGIIK